MSLHVGAFVLSRCCKLVRVQARTFSRTDKECPAYMSRYKRQAPAPESHGPHLSPQHLASMIYTINTTAANSTGAHRVLGLYEFIEDIILYLPLKDLLLCQRVSRAFKAVVDRSQKVQQASRHILQIAWLGTTMRKSITPGWQTEHFELRLHGSYLAGMHCYITILYSIWSTTRFGRSLAAGSRRRRSRLRRRMASSSQSRARRMRG